MLSYSMLTYTQRSTRAAHSSHSQQIMRAANQHTGCCRYFLLAASHHPASTTHAEHALQEGTPGHGHTSAPSQQQG
jgi:hypothetical protein